MHIVVTRPEEEALMLAARLRAAGHEVTVEPLMRLVFANRPAPDLTGAQALLMTSANGVRAFARLSAMRGLPVFAVGAATARAAAAAGFARVVTAGGDVESLAEVVSATLDPEAGRLIHGAGSVVAGDLKVKLESRGFVVERAILYEMIAAGTLSPGVVREFRDRRIDLVLLFSPRTARLFAELSRKHGIEELLDTPVAACLSLAVKDALHSPPWRRIVVAKQPTEQALLDAAGLKIVD